MVNMNERYKSARKNGQWDRDWRNDQIDRMVFAKRTIMTNRNEEWPRRGRDVGVRCDSANGWSVSGPRFEREVGSCLESLCGSLMAESISHARTKFYHFTQRTSLIRRVPTLSVSCTERLVISGRSDWPLIWKICFQDHIRWVGFGNPFPRKVFVGEATATMSLEKWMISEIHFSMRQADCPKYSPFHCFLVLTRTREPNLKYPGVLYANFATHLAEANHREKS